MSSPIMCWYSVNVLKFILLSHTDLVQINFKQHTSCVTEGYYLQWYIFYMFSVQVFFLSEYTDKIHLTPLKGR